jgi:hypothetical protein
VEAIRIAPIRTTANATAAQIRLSRCPELRRASLGYAIG